MLYVFVMHVCFHWIVYMMLSVRGFRDEYCLSFPVQLIKKLQQSGIYGMGGKWDTRIQTPLTHTLLDKTNATHTQLVFLCYQNFLNGYSSM